MKKTKAKKKYNFELKEEYDEVTLSLDKIVYLDGKNVFKLDPLYLGTIRKDQTQEVADHLSKLLKKTVTKADIQRGLTFGYIEV